jgi:exopolysaccharide biosynthesis polyprenyl glycosylphosphotransferase
MAHAAAFAVIGCLIAFADAGSVAERALAAAQAAVAVLLIGGVLVWTARRAGFLRTTCIVLGSADRAARVMQLVERHAHGGIEVVGRVPGGARRLEVTSRCPVLGATDELEAVVRRHRATLVVVAEPLTNATVRRRIRALRHAGVAVVDYAGLYEELVREAPVEHVDEQWLLDAAGASSRVHARHLKRVMDVLGACVMLVPASVVMGVAAIAIRATSPGPVVFRQERCGLGGKPFFVLKLRTMYQDAESRGAMWSIDHDPRVTPVGRVLRRFRVDELPQLVNVLRGEMSLVGPRPERPVFTDLIAKEVPLFPERLMVRPGITGWAQVMAPYAASIEDSRKKLQYDLYYAKHLSARLDLLIAAKTIQTMLLGRERVQNGMRAGAQAQDSALPLVEQTAVVRRDGRRG